MRSDIKLAIIFGFAVLIGVIGMFAWRSGKPRDITGELPRERQPALRQEPATQPGDNAGRILVEQPDRSRDRGIVLAGPDDGRLVPATQPMGVSGVTLSTQPGRPLNLAGATTRRSDIPAGFSPPSTGVSTPGLGGRLSVPGPTTGPAVDIDRPPLTGGRPMMPPYMGGDDRGTSTATAPALQVYTVKKGDTIWTVAKAHKVSRKALCAANKLPEDAKLALNQKLKIPAEGTGLRTATTRTAADTSTDTATTATRPAGKTYKTKQGDTLGGLARQFYGEEKSWKKIYEANKKVIGSNPNVLKTGITLTIPQ